MASINQKEIVRTHENGAAKRINPLQELRRSVMACLLWEKQFYEDGQDIAARIASLVAKNKPEDVAALAIEARSQFRLRHAPLLLVRELARGKGSVVGKTLSQVIQRADELTEFLAIYWKDGKRPLSAQVKKGLASAFRKFDAYQLAKYNRDGAVKLRDALFLCHAKPKDEEQEAVWKRLVDKTLPAPDTWEVALSGGADKKTTFERLIAENNLGYMALLRNLRNMKEAGVDKAIVADALMKGAAKSKALPFRFVAAARAVPAWEDKIDAAMQLALGDQETLPGKTAILVDVSGSMEHPLSAKSDLRRIDAAAALAVLLAGIADDLEVYTFSTQVVQVPPRAGMALVDAIHRSQVHSGTYLGQAVTTLNAQREYDRLIVITDEQSADRVPDPRGRGYVINVASYKNGVGYGKWIHIDGFSEAVVGWIREYEKAVP